MKIKQLGNGGGIASALEGHVNSAFLIDLYEDHSEYLLFDCGYNIMKRLEEEERDNTYFEIAKIKYVIISHKHDDHCGNLETLIYWNHFKNNVQMHIYVACDDLAKGVRDTRKIEDNFHTLDAQTHKELDVVGDGYFTAIPHNSNQEAFSLTFKTVYHGAKPAIGVIINGFDNRSILISGDTKAHKSIEDFYDNHYNNIDLVFHDFSNWDDESKNIHACQTDFEREYSEDFKAKITKYHTGSLDFNKEWQ